MKTYNKTAKARNIVVTILIALCPAICWAQGDIVYDEQDENAFNREMLRLSKEMFEQELYDSALFYINKAEMNKGKVQKDPELAADIHEQYCLIFSALDDIKQSNYHRNVYLDIRERARLDNSLSEKAAQLLKDEQWLSIKITILISALVFVLVLFIHFKKKFQYDEKDGTKIKRKKEYDEISEQLDEKLAMLKHQLRTKKEMNAEKRAKLAAAISISPLIARVQKSLGTYDEYAKELLAQIESYNKLLTDWIQLEQGKLVTKVETFSLSELQNMLVNSKNVFSQQGIQLELNLAETKVKADRTLTLFMINTLADNARKAIEGEGKIDIYSEEKEEYVEVSVKDTGKGMPQDVADTIFTHSITNGHGFGLLNCRGIINSYKKVGRMFNCCMIGVESELGKGTRFFFRLPIVKMIAAMIAFCSICIMSSTEASARPTRYDEVFNDELLRLAADYADSAYYCNVDGRYETTLLYADSVQICLMQTESDPIMKSEILVDISNEAAVASLALHRWEDYRTYNNTYEIEYKRLTTDEEIVEECDKRETFMSDIRAVWTVSNILTAIIELSVCFALYYLWRRKNARLAHKEKLRIDEKEALTKQLTYENEALHISNNILANGLSTVKHETTYYPSRIAALVGKEEAKEMTQFYEEFYGTLTGQIISQKLSSGIKIETISVDNEKVRVDRDLYDYMLSLIRKYLNKKTLDITAKRNGNYVDVIIDTELEEGKDYFAPEAENIPLLICRQIMREMETNTSRGNGIIVNSSNIILRFG